MRPHGAEELKHPDTNVYIVGMKSYGRAPTFLLLTGYEQVRSVVAAIAGDWEAARRVELVLPETGVCITQFTDEGEAVAGSACCGPREEVIAQGLQDTTAGTSACVSSCGPTPVAVAPPEAASVCCGGPAKEDASACCVKDEQAKASGQAGCGCAPARAAITVPASSAACCG